LRLSDTPPFEPDLIRGDRWTLWRYADILGQTPDPKITLGAGGTPLIQTQDNGLPFHAKLEHLNPSGSYKDRGIETLLHYLIGAGADFMVEESSGNAGASIALYTAHARIRARVFVPMNAPENKKRAIAVAAEIVEVPGPRSATTDACLEAVEQGATFASHAWNPYFIHGQMTLAWELWEQLGRRAPGTVVMPVGQGGLLLGVAMGFRALHAAGLIDSLPRLIGVQSSACDPVVRAFNQDLAEPTPVVPQPTIADGITIASPVRGAQVLAAIRESAGMALSVTDEEVIAARQRMQRRGLLMEPTSAAVIAALSHLNIPEQPVVVINTGHGLKTGLQEPGD
jgi:threonine synthase